MPCATVWRLTSSLRLDTCQAIFGFWSIDRDAAPHTLRRSRGGHPRARREHGPLKKAMPGGRIQERTPMTATVLDFHRGQRLLRPRSVYTSTMSRLRDQWAVKREPKGVAAFHHSEAPEAA